MWLLVEKIIVFLHFLLVKKEKRKERKQKIPIKQLLTGTKSIIRMYSAIGSIPEIFTWKVGNIRLWQTKIETQVNIRDFHSSL